MTTLAQAYEHGYQDGMHVASEESAARIEDLESDVARLARERTELAGRLARVGALRDELLAECDQMRHTLSDICAHNYCDEDCPLFVAELEPCRIAGHGGKVGA